MLRTALPAFSLSPPIFTRSSRPVSTRTSSRPRWTAVTSSPTATTSFRLAPSDFAFLWDECKRCFYLKAHKQLPRPRAPFPSVFGNIDGAMKRHFRGLRTTDVLPDMEPGIFLCEENDAWVECLPITPKGYNSSVFIRGMVDCLVRFDDGTFGIIDFKTSQSTKPSTYSRQLHAYALALESPSPNSELDQASVSDMGLVVYSPKEFHTPQTTGGTFSAALTGDLTYVNVPRDDEGFERFLAGVLDVLILPSPPSPPRPNKRWGGSFSSCPYCQFLHDAANGGFIHGHELHAQG